MNSGKKIAIGGSMTETTVASTRHSPSVSIETKNGGSPSFASAPANGVQSARRCVLSHSLGTFAPNRVM